MLSGFGEQRVSVTEWLYWTLSIMGSNLFSQKEATYFRKRFAFSSFSVSASRSFICHHGISHNECQRARHSFSYERGIEIGSYPWNSLVLPCAALSSRLYSFIERPVWVQYGFQLRNIILWVWGAFPSGYCILHETPAEPPLNRKLRLPLAIGGSSHWINSQQVSLYWPCCFSTSMKERLDCYHTVKKR